MFGIYRNCQCRNKQIHKLSQIAVYQCSVFFDLGKVNLSSKYKKPKEFSTLKLTMKVRRDKLYF